MTDTGTASDIVTTSQEGAVLVVTVDDGKANALSRDVGEALRAEVARAVDDDSVGAIALFGRDGLFSGGFHLPTIQGGDQQAIADMVRTGGRLVRDLYGSPVPVVAGCTGHAVAAGALMLLGCDIRIGVDAGATIGLNEVAISLTLPDWALAISVERLSRRHLQSSVGTALLHDPQRAVDAGFLDRIVPAGELRETVMTEANRLAELHGPSYAATIGTIRRATLDRMDGTLG